MEGNPKNYDVKRERPAGIPEDQMDYPSLDGLEGEFEFPLHDPEPHVCGYESITHPDEPLYQSMLELIQEENLSDFAEKIKAELRILKAPAEDFEKIDRVVREKDLAAARRMTQRLYNNKRVMER